MDGLLEFLRNIMGDVYKLLPMKEAQLNGDDNHIELYLQDVLMNMKGARDVYPELCADKQYLYSINKMQNLLQENIEFSFWRKVILDTTATMKRLFDYYEPRVPGKHKWGW